MVTLPPAQPPPSEPEPRKSHQIREVAESFGTDPERYDRARPRYPDALIERIVAASPGPRVLDVGCGTGIAARQFQAAGCTVLGVEPDARMAGFARRTGVEVEEATIETWDPAGREFDAVVAAQVWHWVEPVAGAAKAAQVLRPGGQVSLFWHTFQAPPEISQALAEAFHRVVPDPPIKIPRGVQAQAPSAPGHNPYQQMVDKAAAGMREAGGFGDPQQWQVDWDQHFTRDAYLDLVPTQGTMTRLPPDALKQILDAVAGAIDAIGGSFTMSHSTVAVTATRTPAP
jgi:SAM-dependent methyltransferase